MGNVIPALGGELTNIYSVMDFIISYTLLSNKNMSEIQDTPDIAYIFQEHKNSSELISELVDTMRNALTPFFESTVEVYADSGDDLIIHIKVVQNGTTYTPSYLFEYTGSTLNEIKLLTEGK